MAETFVSFEGVQELAQQLKSKFAKVGGTVYGQMVFRDPASMTVGGHYSQTRESDFNDSEQILYSLGQAKSKVASSPSLVKYHFDTDIETIIADFKGANEAIADIGDFLMNLTELYQQTEAKLIARLDDFGGVPKEDRIWVEDTLDPIGVYTDTRRGLIYAMVGLADWSSLLATGEDGQYGLDACLVDTTVSKTTRNDEGNRVTDSTGFKLGCITAKVGGGETSDGYVKGLDLNVTFISGSRGKTREDTKEGFVLNLGAGDGITGMTKERKDGTTEESVGAPKVPLSGTFRYKGCGPYKTNCSSEK